MPALVAAELEASLDTQAPGAVEVAASLDTPAVGAAELAGLIALESKREEAVRAF
ncbi:hypothetical protein HK102_011573, partial [Quaeritorhiza haematococci]